MGTRNFHNRPPADMPDNAPADAVKAEFAARLQRRMADKGWNQSELARRASVHLENGEIGRDSVSIYMRGKSLPNPANLAALARALGCEPADLLPSRGVPSASSATPPLDARDLGDDRAWLRVNQAVRWSTAIQIMQLIREDKGQ